MKIALLRLASGWLMGFVDDEQAQLIMAPAPLDEDAENPPVTLLYPAEVQPSVMQIPGKFEGQNSIMGQCFPIWLQVPHLRVACDGAVGGGVYEVPALIETDAMVSPLVRAYLASLATAGITVKERGEARVKLGQK